MNCTLTILDPTLAHYLGQNKFESYKDFQKAITNRVNDGLVPLKGEIVPVIHGDKLLIEGQEFNNANDVVKLVITGMLDSNDPVDHFRSFLNTFDSLVKRHQEPLIDTSEKLEDKSFIESMVPFFENYPIDITEPVYQEFLSKKESFFNLYKTLEEELESEEEVETNESEWMDSQESTFFEYTKAAFYKPSKKSVLDLTHPLSLLKHNVSNEVERQMSEGEVFGVSFAKDNAFNAQTVENIEDTDFYKKGGYGVVAYLYKKVGNDWQRVYVKNYENKYNGKVELTTDKTQATEIGQNKVTGFVYTLPDFSKEIYGKVSPSVRQSLISFRNEVKSTGVESPIFQIRNTIKEYPKAPSGKYFERVITAKEFLQGDTKSKLILASKEDFLLRPGNLFLQMEHGKVPLDRTPLNEKWQDRVFSLVNANYTESDAIRVAEFLNKLLDFKGGDLKFITKGNKIVPLLKFDFNKRIRFEHPKEINSDDLIEALKKAKINVFKDWVGQEVLFPIIFNGGLQFSKVNFNDFYLDHHQTTYRQVNVEGSNEFGPIKSLLFDVETQADQVIKEREQLQENPVFGSLPIEKDSVHSTLDVIKEFPTLINKVRGINNDVLVILNSLLENEQVQERLKDSTVTFTTQYGQDFKGISDGKEILVNFYLHTNPEFLVELVAHEVIHTLTADWITSNSTDPLVERLEELVKQVPESVVNLIGEQGYSKDDPRFKLEVLARLSDPKVVKELKKIETGKKNFLETLKDIVKEILGKIFGINSQSTLYSDFLESLIEISTKVKEKKEHTSIYDQFSISDLGDLTFGYSQEDVDAIQNKFSPVYLEQAINRLNGEIFHFIHSKGGSNQFLNGEVSFDKVFLHYYQSVVDYLKANEGKVGKEEHDFLFEFLLKNRDFVKDYWIENTNLASLRKPKKGEYISNKVVEDYEPLSDPNEVTDSENEEKEKELRDITGGEEINEKTFDFDRSGVEQSSLEAADPISRAFVKMIPKIEKGEEGTKIYSDEDRRKAIDNGAKSDHFVSVPGGFIKYETDETNSIVLNDYTQNWNLMGIHFQGKMSLEEMLKSIDDTPSLIDVVPEIYVFKDRLSLDIKNDSQFTLNASLERAFKKAFVNTYVLIRNEDGRLYLVNESKDLTMIGKRKIDSGFLQTIDEKYPQFYERETDEVRIKALIEFLRSRKENENKSLSELLGFGFYPKTIKNNGVFTSEITEFDEYLENMFTNTELVNVPISISEVIFKGTYVGNKKIDGAAGLAKSVLKLEDKNRPLSATTVIKNPEGKNQSILSVLNAILQYREILNNAQTIEELNEKMERTKNPLFNYSLTKKALFTTLLNETTNELVEERTNVKVDIGLFSGFKQEQKGRATKGKLTIDLEGADWLMLNFVGMIKGGIIENTRAETASTSYYFKLTNWSNEVGTSDTPLKISDVFSQYNKRERKINISKESKIFNIWSDYFKGNLERMNLQQSDKWGLFDFLSKEGKEVLRDGLNENVLLDELNSFFNKELDEFRRMFDQEIGGYEAIVGDAMVLDTPTYGDRELWNKVKGFEEEYKVFYVLNSMIIHTEETILFQGDLSQTPKYYKRAKGVQSTGTPVSQSPSLVQWVNKSLENNSIAVALGFTPIQIGKNYLSSTMKDDERPSAYKDRFLDGFVKSQKLYYSSIGVNISEDQLKETAKSLLTPKTKKGEGNYGMVNIGDGAAYAHPDFYYSILKLIGNVSTEQQKVYEALVLDTIKNSKEYFGIESRQITDSEEKKIKEGFDLLAEGKGQFPLIKFTYRNTMSNSNSVVKEEVMDKFALFPLFPQFVHDKPVAKEMLKSMMKEGLGYVKFQSGTKIDTTPPIDFIGMVEKGEVDVSFENFTHELSTEFLREQIKTPNKHKTKNTFGSQVRKNILAELGQVKLSREKNKGDFKRKWETLNQEFSLALKREILGKFKIKETAPDQWDFTKVDKAQVAQILLEESTRRELPYNLKVFFDKYRRGVLKEAQLISAYDLFESSMGAPQIQNLLASIIKKISIQKLKGSQYRQVASSLFDRKIKSEGKTRELGFYEFNEEGTKAAECKIGMGGDFLNLLNLNDVTNYIEYRQQEDTIFNRLHALNKKLEDDAWVEAHKDVLTIASYRIPNQGHNSDEVFIIREFLPPMHAGEIILPPEVTTQSGTDYDYDKMSAIVPKIDSQGRYIDYKNLTKEYQELTYEDFLALKEEKKKDISLLKEEKSFVLNKLFARLKELKGQKDKEREYKSIYDKFIEFQVYEINYEISERESIISELRQASNVDTSLINHTRDQIKRLVEYRRNLINARKENRLEYENFKQSFELQKQEVKQEQWEVSFNYSDSLRDKYDDLTKLNTSFYNKKDAIQNEMIKTFSDILLDPVNYWKLIVPNSNQIIFDLLKEKLLPKLYPNLKLDSFSPSEIITLGRNYRQFKSVQGKNLLGIAAVWYPFTTILQNHNISVNSVYKKKVGFGTKAFFIEVPINPLFGSTDVSLYTKDNLNKLEVITQLINVTVDMLSDDTFGMSVFTRDDFSAFIYGMSLLNYGFENSMMLFHQPIIYKFKDLVSKTVRKGYKKSRANLMVAHKLLDIELIKTQDGNINVSKSEANLFKKLTEIEKSLNSELLVNQLKSVEEAVQTEKFSDQQKAVLAHYLKLLDQTNQVRTVQSALNFDTSPDNNLAKTRDREKDFIEAFNSEIIPFEKIIEVKENSVISGLYVSDIYENLVSEIFPVLYSSETKKAFDKLRDRFVEHSEVAFRKATNDFMLAVIQNYGTYKNQNIIDFTLPYIRGDKKVDLIREATKIKKQLRKQGKRLRLLDILVANTSRKGTPTLSNPQLIMGMENSSGDKDQITEEFRELLNNPKTKDFAETLAIVGLVQSGWSKSPLYFSDVIPEEFITPIINKALKEYQGLSKIDKRGFIIAFQSNFEDYQAKSLGGRGNYEDAYRLMDYTVNVQPTIEATRKAYEEKKKEDEFTEYEVIETETETKQLGSGETKGTLPMQPDNIEMIKSGRKVQTIRSDKFEDGMYTLPDGTKVEINNIYGGTIKVKDLEDFDKDRFAYDEGFKDWTDFVQNNKFSSKFISGEESRYVYSIKPVEQGVQQSQSKDEYLDYVETLNKNKTSDTYQYYGATYTIILENGKGINIEGYQGKNKNKQKLLEAYNANPNVDPQSGKAFREEPTTKPLSPSAKYFYEFSDGFKVDTDFVLNEEQRNALKDLEDFINGNTKTIALSGAAGTGKTTVISILDKWLKNKKYTYPKYSAPTHRANAVTKLMNPKASVYTLHSLFGLTPDIEFEESNFDVKELEFAQKNKPKVEKGDVLIIDESSMISDSLFDFLENAQKKHDVRIVYVGDYAQLKPVKQKEKSKVFTGSHKVSSLVKVERTGENAVLAESVNIREGKDWTYQTSLNSKGEGVIYVPTRAELFKVADDLFQEQSLSDNKLMFRILSATNKAVGEVNQMVRKVLYKDKSDNQLVTGELLMGYDSFDYNYKTGQFKLYNGGDYEVKEVKVGTKVIENIDETFTGFNVLLQNVFDSKELPISIFVANINEDDSKAIKLADEIQKLQKAGQKAMSVGMGQEAAFYFAEANALKSKVAFMKDITKLDPVDKKPKVVIRKTFDYGYAHTIHKAQGGTYENVMILADTLAPFDKNTQQELKYVAVSRAKKIAYIRTDHELNPSLVQDNTQEQLVFTKGTQGIGKEISSYQYGLEYALTNPVFTSPTGTEWKRDWTEGQSKWREYMSKGIEFEGFVYKDVEHAYQQNKSRFPIGKERDDFMQSLLEIKLRTYPKLIEGIDAKGGVSYLADSTHQPTKKNSHWETGGNNAFIELLTKAYLNVKGTQKQTYGYTQENIKAILKDDSNKPTGIDLSNREGILWGTVSSTGSESDFQFQQASVQPVTDVDSLQSRIGSRTFSEVWNSRDFSDMDKTSVLLHSIQERMLDRNTFNGRLFEKINRQLGLLELRVFEGGIGFPLFFRDGHIYINMGALKNYLNKSGIEDIDNYLNEELTRLLTDYQKSLEAREINISYGSEDNYLEALKKVSEQRGKIKWEDVFRNYSRFPQRVKNSLTRSSTLRENDKLFSGGSFETSGRRIESIQDLADLYLVHRSPTIEKLHYIFLKNNEIVATHAATAGLVNRTAKFDKKLFEKTYEESGADSVYLLHNHPSGNHLPSDADLLMTHQITKSSNVNFKGQLIINTDKFSFIPATKDIFKYLEYEEVDYKKKPDVLFKTRITLGTSTKQITNSLKQIGDILLKEPGINSVIYLDVYATIVGYDSFTDGDVSKIDFQDQMKKKGAYSYVIFSPSKESNDAVESSSNHVKGYSSFYLENGQIKASLRFDKEFTNQVDLKPNQIQFWEKVFFQPEDVLDTITQPKICTKM